MSPFFVIFVGLLLASTCYATGRWHAQLSYRVGYRFGYRQGYCDGDRGAWHRRRREEQEAIAPVLAVPAGPAPVPAGPAPVPAPVGPERAAPGANAVLRRGTTYTGSSFAGVPTSRPFASAGTAALAGGVPPGERHATDVLAGWTG